MKKLFSFWLCLILAQLANLISKAYIFTKSNVICYKRNLLELFLINSKNVFSTLI
jgi:hypothetical protein